MTRLSPRVTRKRGENPLFSRIRQSYVLLSNRVLSNRVREGEYQNYYCYAHRETVGYKSVWDNSGASHLEELSQKTKNVILRRIKNECLNLPTKIRTLKLAKLNSSKLIEWRSEINGLVFDYKERVKSGKVNENAEALVTLGIIRKIGSIYKIPPCIEMSEELLEQSQQVVIFTEFVETARELHAELGGKILTGETPVSDRQSIVDRFQSGESKVIVGSIKAGGVGITLTAASNVILLAQPWTLGNAEQAEDRTYRIGQKETVASFWVQLGMIDHKIDQLLASKQENIEIVLKGKQKVLKSANLSELAVELLKAL